MNHRNRTQDVTGRTVIKSAAAAYSFPPKFGTSETFAAEPTHTMVIAAPAAPQSLDYEFDVSLGTIDAVGASDDNLLEYEKIPDSQVADALREDIDAELFRKLPEEWRKRKLAELPIGRAGSVEEIAPTALLLASEEGAYYLGATLNPNGGDLMV